MYHDTNQEIHLASHTIHAKAKCICGAYNVASIIRFCWLLVLHFLAMVAPRDGVSLKMPPKKRVLDKTALGAFKTYFNFREKLENHDTQRMRVVPVDQRVWSDAPAK